MFSVPSKVLTSLCAAKPLLLAVPSQNLAARIVNRSGAGVTVPPHDVAAFCAAARELISNDEMAIQMGERARRYAEACFDINTITDRFETCLS